MKFPICSLVFIFILTSTTSLFSQTLYWQHISPDILVFDILSDGIQNIYCSGESSGYYVWHSPDRGKTWIRSSNSIRLYRLALDNAGILWGGNDSNGGIYKSTDFGHDWTSVLSSNDQISSITVAKNNWIWAGTWDGKILFSSDNGSLWQRDSLTSGIIESVTSNNFNHIFIGTSKGKIFRSTDSGVNWELLYMSAWNNGIGEIVIDESNTVYASKWDQILISSDNGITWDSITGTGLFNLTMDKYHNFYWEPGYRSLDNCLSWRYIGGANDFAFIDSLVYASTNAGVFLYDPTYIPYIAETYFPLTVGNKWQFSKKVMMSRIYNSVYYIDRDSVIDEKKYFLIQGSVNDCVRYDYVEDKLLLRWNDTDYVVMDFSLNQGSTFPCILFNSHKRTTGHIKGPFYVTIFDSIYHTKRNNWYELYSTDYVNVSYDYSETLGETREDYYYNGPGGSSYSYIRKLIRAIIHDSLGVKYYSDSVKPEIIFQPVNAVKDFELEWNLIIDHNYSYFSTLHNENFIDSVIIFSYYSNGDSVFTNDPYIVANTPNSSNYLFSYQLDSMLMKDNFSFYYKIYAVDKGIVPEHSILPDTGYFKLIYDPALAAESGINTITEYSLGQNYPNPFNPQTTINYNVAKSGKVLLRVYDIIGNDIAKLVDENKDAGTYYVNFNAGNFPSGIYIYRIQAGEYTVSKKMTLIK